MPNLYPLLLNIYKSIIATDSMQVSNAHGICPECLALCDWNTINAKKSTTCINCPKQPDVLYNQQPYCTACYLHTFSSPLKPDKGSDRAHKKSGSFLRPVNKSEIMKKSFLNPSGRLLRKIQKLFTEKDKYDSLITYLNKKAVTKGTVTWDKLSSKISKSASIIYIFVGKEEIIGAFHSEPVSMDGEHSIEDAESGIFLTNRQNFNLQFAKVNDDIVEYSRTHKKIKFGQPSSFQISLDKQITVRTELVQKFDWTSFYTYRP